MRILRPLIILILALACAAPVQAQSLSRTRDRKARLEKDIKTLERQLSNARKKEDTAAGQLNLLHAQTTARRELLKESERELKILSDSVRFCRRRIDTLTSRIDTRGSDEPARLLQGLADMQAALSRLVGQVRASSASIEAASREVASGNLDLSHRTEQAAKHLQSTASAMEELSAKVRHSAESAATANHLAGSASSVAERGGTVVGDVVATMTDIHGSSQRIADIIATIDGIAFQTNILALNAAVEAARAGEQGRGFAVVAGEVRSLAQRSAGAAREIKQLIGASVERVDAGTRLVNNAGGTMGEIVASVQKVRDMIGGITAVSGTQSQDLAQISGAITQLDQVTQQNAALVEESAAAAESLKAQAEALAAVVATFRLQGEGHSAAAAGNQHVSAHSHAE